jgi:hypothetical protein
VAVGRAAFSSSFSSKGKAGIAFCCTGETPYCVSLIFRFQLASIIMRPETVTSRVTKALLRLQIFCNSGTVAFSFVFDKFYLIMD